MPYLISNKYLKVKNNFFPSYFSDERKRSMHQIPINSGRLSINRSCNDAKLIQINLFSS